MCTTVLDFYSTISETKPISLSRLGGGQQCVAIELRMHPSKLFASRSECSEASFSLPARRELQSPPPAVSASNVSSEFQTSCRGGGSPLQIFAVAAS